MLTGPIARSTIHTSTVLGLRLLVQAGTILTIARMLGPESFGAFAGMASLAVLLGALSSFGTQFVLLSDVSKNPKQSGKILTYAIPSTLLCGSFLFFIYIGLNYWLLPRGVIGWAAIGAIGVTEIILQPLFVFLANDQLARGRVARSQLLITVPLLLRFLSAVAVLLVQFSDPLIIYSYCYIAASFLSLLLLSVFFPAPWPKIRHWRLAKWSEVQHSAGYAAMSLSAMGPSEIDKVLAVKLMSATESGIYAVSSRVIGAVTLPVIALTLSALPRLFRSEVEGEKVASRLLGWIFSVTFGYTVFLGTALWWSAPLFADFFGTQYAEAVPIMQLLCLAVPAMGLRLVSAAILMTNSRPWTRFFFEFFGMVLFLSFSLLANALFGGGGIPFALVLSEWLMSIAGIFLVMYLARRQR